MLFLTILTLIVEIIVLWLPFSSTVYVPTWHFRESGKYNKCFAYNAKGGPHFTQVNSVTPDRNDITTVLIHTDFKSITAFERLENIYPGIAVIPSGLCLGPTRDLIEFHPGFSEEPKWVFVNTITYFIGLESV